MAGCTSVRKTPDEVAQQFWIAMKKGDVKTAQNYTTEDTRMLIKFGDFRWSDASITFDEIRIK